MNNAPAREKRRPALYAVCALLFALFVQPLFAASPNELVNQMLREGFDPNRANLLFGQWSDAKHLMVEFAKSGDQAKIDLAHRIVEHKYTAWEQTWTQTVDDMVQQGFSRPIEGMGPTGGWKKPLTYKTSDPVRFIIDGANADIDATFFGSNPNVTEDFVERAAINWASKTTGTRMTLPDGTPDYKRINEVLKASEVTPFPRHPDGTMSEAFKKNFPEIVHESYPGAYGQRSLEVDYMITDKGKADIVRYDRNGNLVKKGGEVQLTRDQGAETLIEDLTNARYTRLDRMQRLAADYNEKYLGHLGQGAKQDAETTAKMLQRMIEGDSRLGGSSAGQHPLYDKAKAVKEALREGDDDLLRKALGGQSLDDFLQQAQGEMRSINTRNQSRLTEMMDDSLGSASASRLNTVTRALTLMGYGAMTADAVLRARTGEELKEGSKAMATMVAADLAGSAVGSAIGGIAGFASGVGTAMVVGMVVHGGLEWTEEGIDNMLAGYKVDAAMRGIFLNKDNIDKFLGMKPEEIKRIIDSEWDIQQQWGGAYLGKGGDAVEQLKRKREIFEKAMEMQSLINKNKLRAQIVAEIVNDELRKLVERFENGELTAEQLAEAREMFRNDEKGMWAAIFGTDLEALINQRLQGDYSRYASLFEKLDVEPGKPGLWDWLFGDEEARAQARARADENYGLLLSDSASLRDSLGYIDRLMEAIRNEFTSGEDITDSLAELSEAIAELSGSFSLLEGLASSILSDLNESYAKDEDLTVLHQRRSEITALLAELRREVNDRAVRAGNLQAELEKLRRAAAQEALAGMQGQVEQLEQTCGQIATAAEQAEASAAEAVRVADLLGQVDTGSFRLAADEAVTACGEAAQVQAAALKAANNATQAAKAARASYDGALRLLRSCPDKDAVSGADSMLNEALGKARESALSYNEALEGGERLDRIAASVKTARGQMKAAEENMLKADIYLEAFNTHVDNAGASRAQIQQLVERCNAEKGPLLEQVNGLAAQYPWLAEDPALATIRQRISAAGGKPPPPGDLWQQMQGKKQGVRQEVKAAREKIGEYRSTFDACEKQDAPLLAMLESGEAILGLEKIGDWRGAVAEGKTACLAKLEDGEETAAGDCEGDNWYPGCDPNVRDGAEGGPTPTQVTRAGQAGDQFQTPRGGTAGGEGGDTGTGTTPIPTGYTGDDEDEDTPTGDESGATSDDEPQPAEDEPRDDIADEFGTPRLPQGPQPTHTAPKPPQPPAPAVPAKPPTVAQAPSSPAPATTPASPATPQPAAPAPAPKPPPPAEVYGVYLLFDNKSAIWVGRESSLKGRPSGSFRYGGLCRDAAKCPIVYSMKKGPYKTAEEAKRAYCGDLESGPWYSLGVTRVKMTWRENAYAASSVPSCN